MHTSKNNVVILSFVEVQGGYLERGSDIVSCRSHLLIRNLHSPASLPVLSFSSDFDVGLFFSVCDLGLKAFSGLRGLQGLGLGVAPLT